MVNLLNDLRRLFVEFKNKLIYSRLFVLGSVYIFIILLLFCRLFILQILDGEYYQNNYIQKTEKTILTQATRGNIYDVNGKLLAYNKLAYAVTIIDNGDYKNYIDKNSTIYRLVEILHKYDEKIIGEFLVDLDNNGNYYFTTNSNISKKRFLRDCYGLKSIDELDKKTKRSDNSSNISAEALVDKKFNEYKLYNLYDDSGKKIELNNRQKLDIINIRYTMGLTSFHKYDATKVASDIKERTKAAILENAAKLLGVNIEQETLRLYNDSVYFSSLIGYTGKIQENQLEQFKEKNEDYSENDIVGRIGIEEYLDYDLRGKKGYKIINVDNVGHILDVKQEVLPQSGNDIYLSIDRDLQIGIYNILEQQLTGILTKKIVYNDNPNNENTNSTDRLIPVKDAYFQLINNNILSIDRFEAADAGYIEKNIYAKYSDYYANSISKIKNELNMDNAKAMKDLDEDLNAFLVYIYNFLSSDEMSIIKKELVNQRDEEYLMWKEDNISLRNYLQYLASNNLIDTTKFGGNTKYLSVEDIYNNLSEFIIDKLKDNLGFKKILYKYLIKSGKVSGREICLSLYEQGILKEDKERYNELYRNSENYAYNFLIDKISKLEITPAQLALEPCSAAAVVTDVKTGKLKALVSYPGYDNNKLSNVMDVDYYNKLLNDESLPLYNNATQTKKAPGSIFKPITAIAGLEEHVVKAYEKIKCTGEYDTIEPHIKCWIYPSMHGELNMVQAIQNSCNYYFAEIGHRLSLEKNGDYNPGLGIERLAKYARLFGLDQKSGVELVETEPMITNKAPERSSIGQGSNSFSNVQLSRYVSAIANRGNLFDLSILEKEDDKDGRILKKFEPKLKAKIDIKESTWDTISEGMFKVISEGSAKSIFSDLPVEIAGKTGTAQESKTRANHAFFLSFAPYKNPEIAVTVNIPYGYSSSNAATIAKNIYKLYFGYTSLDIIMQNKSLDVSNIKIGD